MRNLLFIIYIILSAESCSFFFLREIDGGIGLKTGKNSKCLLKIQTRPGLKTLPKWISVRKGHPEKKQFSPHLPWQLCWCLVHSASASLKGWGELRPSFIASALRTSIGKIAQGLRISHLCRLFSWNHLGIIFSWKCLFSARSHVCVCVSIFMCVFLYIVKWNKV